MFGGGYLGQVAFGELRLGAVTATATGIGKVQLDSLDSPQTGTQTLRIRARASSGSGVLRTWLYDSDGTTIRGGPTDFTLTGSFQTFSLDPSGITDYSALIVAFQGRNEVGGALTVEVSWIELRVPIATGAAPTATATASAPAPTLHTSFALTVPVAAASASFPTPAAKLTLLPSAASASASPAHPTLHGVARRADMPTTLELAPNTTSLELVEGTTLALARETGLVLFDLTANLEVADRATILVLREGTEGRLFFLDTALELDEGLGDLELDEGAFELVLNG